MCSLALFWGGGNGVDALDALGMGAWDSGHNGLIDVGLILY